MNERELTPEEERHVRDLLAEARADEPIPEDVATRLDETLADLATDRVTAGPGPVTSLSARRNRRNRRFLAAAAAVAVVGFGAQPALDLVRGSGAGDDFASTAEDAAGRAEPESRPVERRTPRDEAGDAAPETAAKDPDWAQSLRSGAFDADAEAARKFAQELAGTVENGDTALLACEPRPGPAAGERVLDVRYDGRRGVLVFREPRRDRQRVDLYLCGRDGLVRSAFIPAP